MAQSCRLQELERGQGDPRLPRGWIILYIGVRHCLPRRSDWRVLEILRIGVLPHIKTHVKVLYSIKEAYFDHSINCHALR